MLLGADVCAIPNGADGYGLIDGCGSLATSACARKVRFARFWCLSCLDTKWVQ
ncbi:hypothetical protein GCM10025779_12600 [Arthrobacter cryoconiti]